MNRTSTLLLLCLTASGATVASGQTAYDQTLSILRGDPARSAGGQARIQIVGGEPVRNREFPWQVGLIAASTSPGAELIGLFCGGSIIADRWVLTAAHCMERQSAPGDFVRLAPTDLKVVIGTDVLGRGGSTTPYGEAIPVILITVHASYAANRGKSDFDVALLELARRPEAPFSLISPVTAAEETAFASPGSTVTVTGWGYVQAGGPKSPELRKVSIPVQPQSTCRVNYATARPPHELTDNMICAGLATGGADSCQGDSGGPLIGRNALRVRQVGVVSWGYGCAEPGLFGVYTRVARFTDWIASVMQQSP